MKRRKPSLPSEVADIYIRRGMPITCLLQCHLQVGPLHMKKPVGAIRRKIAKPGPGISVFCTSYTSSHPWVCLVSGRTVHNRRTFQPTESPIAWRVPSRGHERARGRPNLQGTQGRYLIFVEWEGCSVATS